MYSGGGILIYQAFRRKWQSLVYFVFLFVGSFLVAKILYLYYAGGLLYGERAHTALGTFRLSHFVQNVKTALVCIQKEIGENSIPFILLLFFLVAHLVTLCVCARENAQKAQADCSIEQTILVFYATVWCFVTLYCAPEGMKTLRYIAPGCCLLPLAFVLPVRKQTGAFLWVNMTLSLFCACIIGSKVLPLQKNTARLFYWDSDSVDEAFWHISHPDYTKNPEIPVYLNKDCVRAYIYPYLHDEQTYYIVQEKEETLHSSFSEGYYIDCTRKDGFIEEKLMSENVSSAPHSE